MLKRTVVSHSVSWIPNFSQFDDNPDVEAGDDDEGDDSDEGAVQDVVEKPKLVLIGEIAYTNGVIWKVDIYSFN